MTGRRGSRPKPKSKASQPQKEASKPESKASQPQKKGKQARSDTRPQVLFGHFWPFDWGPGWPLALIELRGAEGGKRFWVLTARSRFDGVLYALRWDENRWLVSGGPKGWRIRRDRDAAMGTGEYHYHCQKNGEEYAVKADGKGSHDTKAGTVLPQKLGDFLADELEIPLDRSGGSYVVHLLPAWTWDADILDSTISIVDGALNADAEDA